ncbi:MAG: hypothetical protein JRI23_09885 [Deltaproteobacteria bacterium]|jgi:signal transduction histidine kinase|nr:hypothetical protein [Deltaproteobacteria bacterium]MBW2531978.1 hypothetical protein [Deltaproteobacteria bacterium]
MHTLLFIGVLLSVAVAALGLAAFFIRAWMRRRADAEYFLFGLLTLCLAVHTALMALGYYQAAFPDAGLSVRLLLDGLATTSKVALPLLLHFAVRYARLERTRRLLIPVYGVTAAFLVVIFAGGWWAEVPSSFTTQLVFGLEIHQLAVKVTPIAYPWYALVAAVVVAVIGLLARTVIRGRREATMALVGAVVLALTMVNDAAQGMGLVATVPLIPIGYLALALGTSLTLVTRYGITSAQLEERSEELRASCEQLQASYAELERTQQQLVKSEQLAVVGELAAVIAHEVRNPLAVVSNAVASLRKGATASPDRAMLLEIIDEEIARLDGLVGQLLNYARPVVPERRPVDLREILGRSLAALGGNGRIRKSLAVEPDVPLVYADPNLLRHAFDNVVANAVQAVKDEGELEVTVEHRVVDGLGSVQVHFEDDGRGMCEEVRLQARAPFFTTRSTGTGLGLSIVERIMDAHGGSLSIDSQPGEGTCVSLTLPEVEPGAVPLAER